MDEGRVTEGYTATHPALRYAHVRIDFRDVLHISPHAESFPTCLNSEGSNVAGKIADLSRCFHFLYPNSLNKKT